MKIHVELDLSQMFASEFTEIRGSGYEMELVEDNSFLEAIKWSIRNEVVSKVLAEWRKSAGEEFNKEVVAAVGQLRQGFMEATIQELLVEPAVKKSHFGNEMVSLRDYLRECIASEFDQRGIDRKIGEVVSKLADSMSKGLTSRYDAAFAGRIVERLHEHKMLRDDVAALMLRAPEEP